MKYEQPELGAREICTYFQLFNPTQKQVNGVLKRMRLAFEPQLSRSRELLTIGSDKIAELQQQLAAANERADRLERRITERGGLSQIDHNAKLADEYDDLKAERDRFHKLAKHYSDMMEKYIGQTLETDKEDGEPLWGGRSPVLHLKDIPDRIKRTEADRDRLREAAKLAQKELHHTVHVMGRRGGLYEEALNALNAALVAQDQQKGGGVDDARANSSN